MKSKLKQEYKSIIGLYLPVYDMKFYVDVIQKYLSFENDPETSLVSIHLLKSYVMQYLVPSEEHLSIRIFGYVT